MKCFFKIIVVLNFLTCFSQTDAMKNDSIFILDKNLLKQDFTKYSSLFQEMTMIEAQEKGIYGGGLNYLYIGEQLQLFFLNREVKKWTT